MRSESDIVVVGNINLDIRITPIPDDIDLTKNAETSVNRIYFTIGGGGANTTTILGTLRIPVTFIGKAGQDKISQILIKSLESKGVCCHVVCDTSLKTGLSINISWQGGNRHFISSLKNNQYFCFEDINPEWIQGKCLMRCDPWFSESMLRSGNRKLFALAKERGMVTSIDINWDPFWSRLGMKDAKVRKRLEWLHDALSCVDLVHGNEEELKRASMKETVEEAVKFYRSFGVSEVVIHEGERGATVVLGEGWIHVPAIKISKIINSTGAGDVLSATYVTYRMHEESPELSIAKANELAAKHIEGKIMFFSELLINEDSTSIQ